VVNIRIGILCCKKTPENILIHKYLTKKYNTYFLNPTEIELDLNKNESNINLILSRVERDYLQCGLKVLRYIEDNTNVKIINSSKSIEICQNKYLTYKVLKEYMPTSLLVSKENFQNIEYLIEEMDLKFPIVVKPVYGGYGNGVLKLDDMKDLKNIILKKYIINKKENKDLKNKTNKINKNDDKNNNYFINNNYFNGTIIQEYIPYKHDLRVFVINNKIVCVMERIPRNDWRANCSLGAETKLFHLREDIVDLVLKSIKKTNADIAGVDVLIDKENNPYILEINITPQFRNIIKYSNIPLEILKFIGNISGNN